MSLRISEPRQKRGGRPTRASHQTRARNVPLPPHDATANPAWPRAIQRLPPHQDPPTSPPGSSTTRPSPGHRRDRRGTGPTTSWPSTCVSGVPKSPFLTPPYFGFGRLFALQIGGFHGVRLEPVALTKSQVGPIAPSFRKGLQIAHFRRPCTLDLIQRSGHQIQGSRQVIRTKP
jgi:hypothetical protein